jgi:hypothetical protein
MKRPVAVTIIGWFFILAGTVGFIYHLPEVVIRDPFINDAVLVEFVRLMAIVGGALVLRGVSVGRWLLITWMAYHVVLSYFHAVSQLITHAVFLALLIYAFLHPKVAGFFREKRGHRMAKRTKLPGVQ